MILAMSAAVSQVRTSGYVEYTGRHQTREAGTDATTHLVTTRIDATTPLWRPWIARFSAGLGFTLSKTDTEQEGLDQKGENVTGNLRLNLFPLSRFPFEAFVERQNTAIESDLPGPETTTNRFGFLQRYNPRAGGRYSLLFRRTETEQERPGSVPDTTQSVDDFLGLNIYRPFRHHTINFDSNLQQTERKDLNQKNDRFLSLLRHRFRATDAYSSDNLVSYTDNRLTDDTSDTRRSLVQLSSTNFWRPETQRPLLVTTTVFASGLETTTDGSESDTGSVNLSGGATYQWTPALNLSATGNIVNQRSDGADQDRSALRARATYTPAPIRWKRLDFRWSTFGELGHRSGEPEGSIREVAGGVSYGIGRIRPLGAGHLNYKVSQAPSLLDDTAGRSEQDLLTTASVGWNRRSQKAAISDFVGLIVSDSRRFGNDAAGNSLDNTFQMINLQAQHNHQLTRRSSWDGGLTIQRTRRITPATPNDDESWVSTSNLTLTYRHTLVFGIPRLRFESNLRLLSRSLTPLLGGEEDSGETNNWLNRLDYQIGRLDLSLRVNFAEISGELNTLIFFNARRRFGTF
jgi:hypothetical protein